MYETMLRVIVRHPFSGWNPAEIADAIDDLLWADVEEFEDWKILVGPEIKVEA